MVDIHMHVIPKVDDGSKSIEESIELLKRSAEQGVEAIIATPHSWAIDTCGYDYMCSHFEALKKAAKEHRIPIRLFLGCEMLVYPDTVGDCIRKLDDGQYPTMAGSRYVLTEFEPWFSQKDMETCVEKLVAAGYIPIIAHAERYDNTTVNGIKKLKKLGALVQINAYSIVNEQKEHTRQTVNQLLEEQLVDFVGSDAHRLDHRPPVIADGIAAFERQYSEEYARRVTELNPLEMLLKAIDKNRNQRGRE